MASSVEASPYDCSRILACNVRSTSVVPQQLMKLLVASEFLNWLFGTLLLAEKYNNLREFGAFLFKTCSQDVEASIWCIV